MHFTIDSRRYDVVIASRPLILDGQPCRAKLDRARRKVWLSDALPRRERRRELLHELRHAWVDARGLSSDDETDARQSAEMMDVLLEQYLQQGGDAVLESLSVPDDAKSDRLSGAGIPRTEALCGLCAAPVAVGSIATEAPEWVNDLTTWSVDRGILCSVCDSVTVWREAATAEGMPTGQILPYPPPRLLDRSEARVWIADHEAICRVQMIPA